MLISRLSTSLKKKVFLIRLLSFYVFVHYFQLYEQKHIRYPFRQPYIEKYVKNFNIKINGVYKAPDPLDYPEADHCHHFGWYIGNYPELGESKINYITEILNEE